MQAHPIRFGIRHNQQQFVLLVVVNALVGAMLGMERSALPGSAEEIWHLNKASALFEFVIVFGFSKAAANLLSGSLMTHIGRLRTLQLGWYLALPIPFLLIFANHWHVVLLANVFMGFHQGLAWSACVVMKIDLVGENERSKAMGYNEFAGYLAIALSGALTSIIAHYFGPHPLPYFLGIPILFLALFLVHQKIKDTASFAAREQIMQSLSEPWYKTRNVLSITQAGLVNNLNDGVLWVLLPLLFLQQGYSILETGSYIAIYPAVWGIAQLFTGRLGDRWSHKRMLSFGMILQGLAIIGFLSHSKIIVLTSLVIIGIGTALVYPIFLSHLARISSPINRPRVLANFRFWRDLGYAVGALCAAWLLYSMGHNAIILLVAILTLTSGLVIALIFVEQRTPIHNGSNTTCALWGEVISNIELQKAILIDVRSANEFEKDHHPLALNFPLDELASVKGLIPPGVSLFTVCGKGGGRSEKAAEILRRAGHANVHSVCGGMNELDRYL
jgi:MFS family permease